MEKLSVSIVIPCYNEFLNLGPLVQDCEDIVEKNKNYNFEFIFVDNGSTDQSKFFFKNLKKDNIRIVTVKKNIGYGNGIIQGLLEASHEVLAWTHADLQTDLSDVVRGLGLLSEGGVLIKGKRVARKFFPKILSLGMSTYAYFKLGVWVSEINAQPKIFNKQFFLKIVGAAPYDFSLDFFFCLNAKKAGKVLEFPVYFKNRQYESPKGGGGSLFQKIKIIKRTIGYINKTKL
mgnify:CR=1 FL=1